MQNKKSAKSLVLVPGALLSLLLALFIVDAGMTRQPGQEKLNRFIGAAKCKSCHKAEETGNQFAAWELAQHSNAFETLGSDRAKEFAAEKGIEDPQTAEECIRCHRTGHGLADEHFKRGFDAEKGVQCETCHGPGENHMKARMTAAAKGETSGVEPGEMDATPTEELCVKCHNTDSPTYKHFCFACRSSKIRHLNPQRRTQEELDALAAAATEACTCEADCEAAVCKH